MKILIYFLPFYANSRRTLQLITTEYDEEYYEYYGLEPDNYEGKMKRQTGGPMFYCWSCNASDLDKCNQNGHLEQVGTTGSKHRK